jgi:hypothetical protein
MAFDAMNEPERWKRAVIHIEGAADSMRLDERITRMKEIAGALSDPESPAGLQLDPLPSRDLRFRGTAVFVADGEDRFLLTARHVVTDPEAAKRHSEGTRPESVRERDTEEERRDQLERWIFPIIFRVPSLDELLSQGGRVEGGEFLMNLQAGVPWMVPYSFSAPDWTLLSSRCGDGPADSRTLWNTLAIARSGSMISGMVRPKTVPKCSQWATRKRRLCLASKSFIQPQRSGHRRPFRCQSPRSVESL